MVSTPEKKRLWIFIDWYLPAYRAGGPIQSVSNLVSRLKSDFEISVITSNLDLGEPLDLKQSELNVWVEKEGYRVIYLDQEHQNRQFYNKLFLENSFEVAYFNSLFSIKFTLMPFLILKNKPLRRVFATRGMLGRGALAIKPLKKTVFLQWFKLMNLHKKVVWHATAQSEVEEIKKHFGAEREILLAPNLSTISSNDFFEKEKKANQLNIFFLSRIAVKKNLLGALEILSKIKITHNIRFHIIGPIDDKPYWEKCSKRIKTLPKHIDVNYLGAIPNHQLPKLLKDEHVLLLPTYGENFGHVIMESWQNSCPVIISDQTPWRDLQKEKLGYDLSIENQSSFVDAIEHLSGMTQDDYLAWSKSSFIFAKSFIDNPEVLEQNRRLFSTFKDSLAIN